MNIEIIDSRMIKLSHERERLLERLPKIEKGLDDLRHRRTQHLTHFPFSSPEAMEAWREVSGRMESI